MEKSYQQNLAAVVLAGGKGTRMQASLPKVLHTIANQPMIFYTLETLNNLGLEKIYVVVGHKSKEVRTKISEKFNCKFAFQATPLGTGHAVSCAVKKLDKDIETILVLNGDDSAFYKLSTLNKFLLSHQESGCPASMMTVNIKRERKLGRIIRDKDGIFEKIVESEKDPAKGITSDEINCGLYIFDVIWLKENINKIKISDKGEYYLTEIFNMAKDEGSCINLFNLKNKDEWMGVNTPDELNLADEKMKQKLIKTR